MYIDLDFAFDPREGENDAAALERWRAEFAPRVRAMIDTAHGGGTISARIDGDVIDVVRAVRVYCGGDDAAALDLIGEYARC